MSRRVRNVKFQRIRAASSPLKKKCMMTTMFFLREASDEMTERD